MIVLEFIVFVVSSGLFCSKNFRHQLWAVIVAGVIASGSSLLFFWDFYERLEAKPQAPVVKVVHVNVPVVQHVSRPPALSKPENCRDAYPFFARVLHQEGTTELAFTVGADGTLSGVKVTKSSGSDRLDDAALDCVSQWHYRPAIKDDQLVDAPMTVKVDWRLEEKDGEKQGASDRPAPPSLRPAILSTPIRKRRRQILDMGQGCRSCISIHA